jgi:hypothetical protein
MARPWKDPKTGSWHLRQRVPQDLLRLKGQNVSLPVGDNFSTVKIGEMVQVSLRTKDQREAKERHAMADAALRRFWDNQRSNTPTRLSHQQAAALAGTLYSDFADILERNPGSPETWATIQDMNQMAREGKLGAGPLMIGKQAAQAHAMEHRFGPMTDALLKRERLVIDEESRKVLIKAVAHALDAAAQKLERNAEFDYSPDPAASRFPKWQPIEPKPHATKSDPTPSVSDLWEQWKTYHSDKKAPTTIERYEASLRSLATFTKGKTAGAVTSDDLYAWAVHRRDVENISP